MDQAFKPQKSSSATYHVMSQDQFTAEHRKYVDDLRESIMCVGHLFRTSHYHVLDTDFHTMMLTEADAKRFGFKHAKEAEGVSMYHHRCDAVQDAKLWEQILKLNLERVQDADTQGVQPYYSETLGVYHYPNGMGFQVFKNRYHVLRHEASSSILGYVHQSTPLFSGLDEERQNILLAYLQRFGLMGTLRLHVEQPEAQRLPSDLSDEEHALCFFTLLGWGAHEICAFLNKYGMRSLYGSSDSEIQAHRHTLAQRLGVSSGSCEDLVDYLVAHDVHRMLPVSFFYTIDRPIPLALCTASQRSRMC